MPVWVNSQNYSILHFPWHEIVLLHLGQTYSGLKDFVRIRKRLSKKEGKDQESIQSSATPDPGY